MVEDGSHLFILAELLKATPMPNWLTPWAVIVIAVILVFWGNYDKASEIMMTAEDFEHAVGSAAIAMGFHGLRRGIEETAVKVQEHRSN